MKYTLLVISAAALLVLSACEGKKSLDGHPMDKPPPSAFAPRDSEPVFAEPVTEEDNGVEEIAADETKTANEGEVELDESKDDVDAE